MRWLLLSLVYLLFFFSGAAALIYEVVWVRSLSLVFGGTHLAVTTVLSVFMGGLALGSYIIGKRVDGLKTPLRFYGILELGIALFAIGFIALMNIYPTIYAALAGIGGNSKPYLTVVRVFFAFFALIVPTTLMGGTLPVLTRFISRHPTKLGTNLSLLYGFNTLGAVFGVAGAAFFLLRYYSVSVTMHTAIAINITIGLASILLQNKVSIALAAFESTAESKETQRANGKPSPKIDGSIPITSLKLVLLGIGISGFCALGYEVLWTRILTLTIGTSVYGFSIMLIAFLTGIALGSESYGILQRIFHSKTNETRTLVLGFGIVQCIIGLLALLITYYIRDLPTHSITLTHYFQNQGLGVFEARQWGHLTLAFSYMVVPAFFMGLAFPIAGMVNASMRTKVGHAVGDVLTANTIGAILGSAMSGFFFIYAFGIERSLQLLAVVNVGLGLLVIASLKNLKVMNLATIGTTFAILILLISNPDAFRMWNARYFAIFQNNQPTAYDTPEKIQEAIDNTDILFYHEGIDSTISSIKVKGGNQAVLVNGKVVASAAPRDRQCQYTLGHLPMLLHPNPRKVLVVGLGTGMTLGATSVHPEVEELTLAEIEPNVVGAARTFGKYNNFVLDDPKLNIVFNDGRNFLMITGNKYDVITADPIHPWTQGSGYLYTAEYFKLASERLLPNGIMCQWLPIYELSVDDLKTVVKTFSQSFKYMMAWITQYDAEIIGSNSPIVIDEAEMERRIAFPAIADDLNGVMMGSATDFLSYFVMGTKGMMAFGDGATINTDDNLFLEYSTPVSVGRNLTGTNINAIAQYRESILPYLVSAEDTAARHAQVEKWERTRKAAFLADRAHTLFLDGKFKSPELNILMSKLDDTYPNFSPGRFIKQEYQEVLSRIPRLLDKLTLRFLNDDGGGTAIEISAVIARVSKERAAVMFADNDARVIFGQRYFSGDDLDEEIDLFIKGVFASIHATYDADAAVASASDRMLPDAKITMNKVRNLIQAKCGTL